MTTTTTTDRAALRDSTDREVLSALADAWGLRVVAAARFGRETGRTGLVSGWRLTVAGDDDVASDHILYLDEPDGTEFPGTAVVSGPGGARRVWRYPEDPGLPALRTFTVPEAARVVLDRLGVTAALTGLELASYRPGRRAVVRATTTAGDLFVKVVPPDVVGSIVARHRAWAAAGLPSPPVLASAREGLVVLGALGGRSAVDAIDDVEPERFVAALSDLRARIAGIPLELPARPSPADRFDWYVDRLARLDDDAGHRARRLASTPLPPPQRTSTVHGDLHLAQVLVDPAEPHTIVGVLDLDTSGTGDPADDDAALWAHLVVLAERGQPGSAELARVAQASWGADASRERIAANSAALLLGHVLSGHLPLDRGLHLAERLRSLPDENPLTAGSS